MLEYCFDCTVDCTVRSGPVPVRFRVVSLEILRSSHSRFSGRLTRDSQVVSLEILRSSHSRFPSRLTRDSQVVSLEIPGSSHSRFPLNFLHGLSSKSSSPINLHTSKHMAGAHIPPEVD